MNSAMKRQLIVFLGSLTYFSSSVSVQSHVAEQISVPEPTQLHSAAEAEGSVIVRSEFLGEINSSDSTGTILAVEVEGLDGDRIRGVKISLRNSASLDQVYIPESLLSSFQDELREIELWRHRIGKCEAQVRCVQGIARCRPSQKEKQAYCPGRFSTPNSEGGFILSTPRNSFLFPSVEATQFGALISDAIHAVE